MVQLRKAGQALLVLALLIMILFPIFWLGRISLTAEKAILSEHVTLLPAKGDVSLEAYRIAFTEHDTLKYLFNSLFIVLCATTVSLFFSISIAYVITKYEFKGRTAVMTGILFSVTIPWIVYILPLFTFAAQVNWLDKHGFMIFLYGVSGIPLFTWFAMPYMQEFPTEMIEGAKIDGANDLVILIRIIIPAVKNVLFALFLIRFIWAYNDLLFSLTFTFHKAKMIMPAILEFGGLYSVPFARMAAGGVIAITPIVLLVIVFQKYIETGLTGRTFK